MMRISKEDYANYADGTIFQLFLEGDEWEEDKGEVYRVIKIGDYLYPIAGNHFLFGDKDEEGFEFSLIK